MGHRLTPRQRADRYLARQHGVISAAQAAEAGLSQKERNRLVKTGAWHRPVRGVYVSAATPKTWQRDAAVAWLAGPEGTLVSHLTAAAALGLVSAPPVPHVTVPWSASGRIAGVEVHRSRSALTVRDRALIGGLACTSPARTVVDCAGLLEYDAFCDLLDAALCRRLTTPARVRAAADAAARRPGRKGLSQAYRALEVWESGEMPGSPPEMKLFRLLQEWGFPTPVRQHPIHDRDGRFVARVDIAIVDPKIIFEYDGEEWHGPRQALGDLRRQGGVEALGWTVFRVRKEDLRRPALRLRARLGALLLRKTAA